MIFTTRTFAYSILTASAICVFATSPLLANDSLVSQYIVAEAMEDKEQSIVIWKDLLGNKNNQSLAKNGFDSKILRANIVNDYVALYLAEKDVDHIKKADDFITFQMPKDEQAWAYIYLLKPIINDPMAMEFIDKIHVLSSTIIDARAKNDLLYALSTLITMQSDASTLNLVHGFINDFNNDDHRIDIIRKYANATQSNNAMHPSACNEFYNLMVGDKYPSKDELLRINKQAMGDDQFILALNALLSIKKDKDRADALKEFFYDLYDDGKISEARRVAEKTTNAARGVDFWSRLGGHYLISGYQKQSEDAFQKAMDFANQRGDSRAKSIQLIDDRKRDALKEHVKKKDSDISQGDRDKRSEAIQNLENNDIKSSVAVAKKIEDAIYRAKTFRLIAEAQLQKIDIYNFLKATNDDTATKFVLDGYTIIDNPETKITNPIDINPETLHVQKGLPSNLGKIIAKDNLPQKLAQDGEMIANLIPLPSTADVQISYYENNILNSKFAGVYGNAGFIQQQGTSAPISIIIQNGSIDIPTLYASLRHKGYDDYLIRDGKNYTLRRPLVIANGASLILTGDDVDDLRLSKERGAYIAYGGDFYASDTKITGWSEAKGATAHIQYKAKRMFRPFLTAWSRSNTYIGNSELIALGYGNGKSYGLSFSAGPNAWLKHGNQANINRPTGIMADNSLDNIMYGYYSYEADDFIINGNEYIDNVVYGIDPHDRSRRLVIGYNTAYDTQNKHGIIISREVNDSLIAGNISFNNAGTGFMIDRESNGTLIYGNTSFDNKNDGMTMFESDCAIIAANHIFDNNGAGMRIRNSHDLGVFHNIIMDNKKDGIIAYNGTLLGDPVHSHRDFGLDPYDEHTSITAVGNTIQSNGSGLNIQSISALFMRGNEFINQSPKVTLGPWFQKNPDLLFRYNQDIDGVSITPTCPVLPKQLKPNTCKFRQSGILSHDGQDDLIERIAQSACAMGVVKHEEKSHP